MTPGLVLGNSPFSSFLNFVIRIATNVANRHLCFFSVFLRHFYQFCPPFLRQRRNVEADDVSVIVGRQPKIRFLDRLLDGVQRQICPKAG